MDWITVLSLISFGLILLVVEVIFIPGTTVVGIAGLVFMIIGVALSFTYFGDRIGWATVAGTTMATGLLIYYSLRSGFWKRFALKTSMEGRVNQHLTSEISVGQTGQTVSALRPSGKAEIGNKVLEVRTLGDYVEPNTRIRVIKMDLNQIVVEPII